jgi:hypothetical protein
MVIVANSDSGATVWTTTDGVAWTSQDSQDFLGLTVYAITASASGFAAVGVQESTGHTFLLTSSDGQRWTLTPNQSESGDTEIHSIVPFRGSFVAVGYDKATDKAAFLIIDDQSGWRRIAIESTVASNR